VGSKDVSEVSATTRDTPTILIVTRVNLNKGNGRRNKVCNGKKTRKKNQERKISHKRWRKIDRN